MARARGGNEDKGRWFALSMSSVTAEPGDQGAGQRRRKGHGVTDDSAFKKQVRARMATTGEKYTVARRMVIAEGDPGRPPTVLRVYLNPHVDLELTAEAARAYARADEQGRLDLADRLLAEQIEETGTGEGRVAADSKIMTGQELHTATEALADAAAAAEPAAGAEAAAAAEAAEDAAIRDAVQRCIDRAVGVSAVEVGRAADRLRVSIRATRPILLAGSRGAEADRLREELAELTGRRVRLDIREVLSPQDQPDLQE